MLNRFPPVELGESVERVQVTGITTERDEDLLGLSLVRSTENGGSGVVYSAELHVDLCDLLCGITLSRGDLLAVVQMLLKGIRVIHADEDSRRLAAAGGDSRVT